MRGYEDLIVWREARRMAVRVVQASVLMKGAGADEAARQLRRAAESVPANIAEGYGRGVSADCLRFLRVARSSAIEAENHLHLAGDLGRLPEATDDALLAFCRRVRFLIARFAASVERRMKR